MDELSLQLAQDQPKLRLLVSSSQRILATSKQRSQTGAFICLINVRRSAFPDKWRKDLRYW